MLSSTLLLFDPSLMLPLQWMVPLIPPTKIPRPRALLINFVACSGLRHTNKGDPRGSGSGTSPNDIIGPSSLPHWWRPSAVAADSSSSRSGGNDPDGQHSRKGSFFVWVRFPKSKRRQIKYAPWVWQAKWMLALCPGTSALTGTTNMGRGSKPWGLRASPLCCFQYDLKVWHMSVSYCCCPGHTICEQKCCSKCSKLKLPTFRYPAPQAPHCNRERSHVTKKLEWENFYLIFSLVVDLNLNVDFKYNG